MAKSFEEYQRFTTPAVLHKSINTLRGIVAGITTDETVGQDEMNELVHWCELQSNLRNKHPFSELLPAVESACSDGVITSEESKDILWLCNNFTDDSSYYDNITSSIQFLAGLIHGVMADGELKDNEVSAIEKWISVNRFLSGTYPYDEINALLHAVLADKIITTDERNELMAFFSNIIEFKDSLNLKESDYQELRSEYNISGICAVNPEIEFKNRAYCFTGEFCRGLRAELEEKIVQFGGTAKSSVTKKTDYLVVGNAGNPCWAYACYGRKIEEAMKLRKEGAKVVIVNETDFWNAADAYEASSGEV